MSEKSYLTKDGFEKLVQELAMLKAKIPQVTERIKEAIKQGDLSENAEYSSAVEEKGLIEARISEIEESLLHVEIIKDTSKKSGIKEVKYGSKVKINLSGEKDFEFTIVGTSEVDILANKTISLDSPLGKAMQGKKVGDEVKVKAPQKRYDVKILEIS